MKNGFVIILFIIAFTSCDITDDLNKSNTKHLFNDEWILSGGRNHLSLKNIHYNFSLSKNDTVKILVETNINEHLYIIDDFGIKIADRFEGYFEEILKAGNYELVIATNDKNVSGNFKLLVSGVSQISKIESNYEQIIDSWTSSGGTSKNSFKNRHYEVEVTKDSYLNIMLECQARKYMYIIDENDFVTENYYDFGINVVAGKYRIVVATYYIDQPKTGSSGNFKLRIFGHINEPIKIESLELSILGKWTNSSGQSIDGEANKRYTFEVTKKSYVDIVLDQASTTAIKPYLYLKMPDGTIKEESYTNRMFYLLSPGIYTFTAATYYKNKIGSFNLKLYGSDVQNLKEKF